MRIAILKLLKPSIAANEVHRETDTSLNKKAETTEYNTETRASSQRLQEKRLHRRTETLQILTSKQAWHLFK